MKKIFICCLFLTTSTSFAQTETDGIMMEKHNLCSGFIYQNSIFNEYWEGSIKRENLNIGSVSSNAIMLMGNYGLSDNLNAIFGISYLKNEASDGTLHSMKGIQDASLSLKFLFLDTKYKKLLCSGYLVGGLTIPTNNYSVDFLPMSIGLQSKTASIRFMGDVQKGKIYTTFSGTYIRRSNIKIDSDSYFTTEYHYSNEVFMPDVISSNFRIGYRTKNLIADVFYNTMVTQKGGFDITRNNMPFPSNTMNASKIGVYAKYTFKKISNLSLIGGYDKVLTGRNVGQSTSFNAGVFYVINFKNKSKENNDEK